MAVAGGVNKAMAFGLGVGVVGVAALSWRWSERRVHQSELEHEAQTELVRFASGVAKCSAGEQVLPDTSERVPTRLADVAGRAYTNQAGDFAGGAFKCASFAARSPQRLQYRWVKDSAAYGRVEARGDANGDGVPDHWYEVRIDCSNAGCEAPNYVHEVLSDGTRVPPGILGLFGRARGSQGEPPSLLADDSSRSGGRAGTGATKPLPAPSIAAGAAIALDTLFLESERRAAAKLPGSVLLELVIDKAQGAVADPAQGTTLTALYGHAGADGALAKGAAILRVSFDAAGLVDQPETAPRALHRIGFADCLPGQLLATLVQVEPRTLTLSWDEPRKRALWRVKTASAPQQSYGADKCALVK